MKGKIRIKKTDDDRVYAVKTTKFISEAEVEDIRQRKERARKFGGSAEAGKNGKRKETAAGKSDKDFSAAAFAPA